MKVETVFDLESDGFLSVVSKIHCIAYQTYDMETPEVLDPKDYVTFFTDKSRRFVCHNVRSYDSKVLKKLLGIDIPYEACIDTLWVSRNLYPDRAKRKVDGVDYTAHGLDGWGLDMGVPKPKIDDWENLSQEEYEHRVIEDVKINYGIWFDKMRPKYMEIYG